MASVTIGFVPRDRFCKAPESMASILEHTRRPFQLIVVDPGIPDRFREPVMHLLHGHPDVTVLSVPPSTRSNMARNLVLDHAEGEFVALIENDCIVQEDWLGHLMRACGEHPADAAVPLLFEPRGTADKVHFDDRLGSIRRRPDGRVEIVPRDSPLESDRVAVRRAIDCVEMHCLVFRRNVFDRIGRFDATQQGGRAEVDLSLALWSAGVPTVLEPKSRVTFSAPPPVYPAEREYYLRYWDLAGTEADHRTIEKRWNLVECPSAMGFVKARRQIVDEPDPDRQVRAFLEQIAAVDAAAADLASVVPPGETLILVDEAQWVAADVAGDRATFPFLEHEGQYWGSPADDGEAIRELERLRADGANFVAFGWPAFWWLDHYRGLDEHLRSRFRCALRTGRMIVFDLRT
jgi:GT2 family glycosyltransferase